MIEINLLPDDLKVKVKGRSVEAGPLGNPLSLVQDRLFIYAIPVILGIFILVHLYLAVLSVTKNGQLSSLNRKWSDLAAQKKELDEFNQEFSASSQDAGVLAQLNRQRTLWAQKLNELSLQLPAGVWFGEILINGSNLTVRGSVISLGKDEVGLINKLLDNLKKIPEFSKDFLNLELNSVQKRSVGGYDIADFVLAGALKPK